MAMLYKAKVIRATPKFVKGMIAVMVGLFAVMLINLVLALFGVNTGLRDGSPLAHRLQPGLHRGRLAELRAQLQGDRGRRPDGPAAALLLDRPRSASWSAWSGSTSRSCAC